MNKNFKTCTFPKAHRVSKANRSGLRPYFLAGLPCPSPSLSLVAVASESPDESSIFSCCNRRSSRKLHGQIKCEE